VAEEPYFFSPPATVAVSAGDSEEKERRSGQGACSASSSRESLSPDLLNAGSKFDISFVGYLPLLRASEWGPEKM